MRPFKVRGYAVERLLGSGGSGDVWQARAAGSGARVALKRIAVRSDDQLRRAHAEAALLCALDHPNLVRLHSVVPTDDAVVLVLDLADGGSLAGLLAARGRLTPGEVITSVAPVAAALAYLHGEGVVHGDVSAANILFTDAGVPMLADVGVARLTGDDADAEATPAYVDPSVAAGCVPGPQSDVFMLGGVALHALTGAPPWPDESADAALARAALGDLSDVAERLTRAGVAPAMSAVVCRALAVDPQRRGTAADLALDLRYSGSPVAVELSAGLRQPEPGVRPGPRHAARPAGSALAGREPADPTIRAVPGASPGLHPSRPAFVRPAGAPGAPGAAPPTRMVGPRPRPVIPRPPQRRRPPARASAVVGAVVLAPAIAVAGVLWSRADGRPAGRAELGSQSRQHVETNSSDAGQDAARGGATSAVAGAPQRAADWSTRLSVLDAQRAKAYATGDAALLRKVYVPGPLLTADTALLRRIVPGGCGLAGARTSYSAVRAVPNGNGVVVTATATLSPSQLLCDGHRRGAAPGAGPTTLRLELINTAAGPRIADQREV